MIESKINLKELKKLLKNPYIRVPDLAEHFDVSNQWMYKFLRRNDLRTASLRVNKGK